MKKLVVGIFISGIFLYFSTKGVKVDDVLSDYERVNYFYLILMLFIVLGTVLIKSLRWGIILSPLSSIGQDKLFPVHCVGNMAVLLIPMRIGEVIRPLIMHSEYGIPMSSVFATIFVERVFDILALLVVISLVVLDPTVPVWFKTFGYSTLLILILLIGLIVLFYFKGALTSKMATPILERLPRSMHRKIENVVRTFTMGFQIIDFRKKLVYSLVLSLAIWGCYGLSAFVLFFAFNLKLPITCAFVLVICVVGGISLPAAPGMIGNFHFAVIYALSLYGVPKSEALAFSVLHHAMGIGVNIVLGILFLSQMQFSFRELKKNRHMSNLKSILKEL